MKKFILLIKLRKNIFFIYKYFILYIQILFYCLKVLIINFRYFHFKYIKKIIYIFIYFKINIFFIIKKSHYKKRIQHDIETSKGYNL